MMYQSASAFIYASLLFVVFIFSFTIMAMQCEWKGGLTAARASCRSVGLVCCTLTNKRLYVSLSCPAVFGYVDHNSPQTKVNFRTFLDALTTIFHMLTADNWYVTTCVICCTHYTASLDSHQPRTHTLAPSL